MKGVLSRFRKRNIQTNFYQFMLVIFVVAVSVCLIAGLFINYLTLKTSINNYFNDSNMPNLWIETNQITAQDETFFDDRFEFDKRFRFESKYKTGTREYEGTFLISGGDVSMPYLFEENKGKGCYVDAKFAKENQFGLNHSTVSFDFKVGGETKKISFKILDYIAFAEDMINDGDCVIFIDEEFFLETLKNNFGGISDDLSVINYNEILVTSDVTQKDIQDIETYYKASTSELVGLKHKDKLESVVAINNEIKTAERMLWIFPIIFVFVSILVIYSAISQLVMKERYNIGLLKSLGISNKQILVNYCGYGTIICFIGAILGLLAAPLIIPNMTFEIYDELFNLPRDVVKLSYPVELIVGAILTAVFVGYISSFFVVLALITKTPKECMSKFSKKGLKSRQKKKKSLGVLAPVFRNMKINLTRTIMSIVGVAGSLLLVLLGFGSEKIMQENPLKNEFVKMEVFSRVFKGFSVVLLGLTIVILIVQIFKERLKEMAVLRIHGEGYVKIWLSVLLEMFFVGVIGFVISILLSGPTMLLNLHIFGVNEYFAINFMGYFKTFLMVFLMICFTASFGLVKIYKLKLDEAIKFSE